MRQERMEETLEDLGDYLSTKMATAYLGSGVAHGELTVHVTREQIPQVLKFLRDDARCRCETSSTTC